MNPIDQITHDRYLQPFETPIPIDVADTIAEVLIEFMMKDGAMFVERFAAPTMHHAMNAYLYGSAYLSTFERVINGCFTYMKEGADDFDDTMGTAAVLSAFESVRARRRPPFRMT